MSDYHYRLDGLANKKEAPRLRDLSFFVASSRRRRHQSSPTPPPTLSLEQKMTLSFGIILSRANTVVSIVKKEQARPCIYSMRLCIQRCLRAAAKVNMTYDIRLKTVLY
jgi:hypothetical protein